MQRFRILAAIAMASLATLWILHAEPHARAVARDGFGSDAWVDGFGSPGTTGIIHAVHHHVGIGGPNLVVGGAFDPSKPLGGRMISYAARWNGTTFSQIGAGFNNTVRGFTTMPARSGDLLVAVGDFTSSGGTPLAKAAYFDGTAWKALGTQLTGNPNTVTARIEGGSSILYAGGPTLIGGADASCVARWNGAAWTPIGKLSGQVWSLAEFDDGTGPSIYASGVGLTSAAGGAGSVQRWNGTQWTPVSGAPNGSVLGMCVANDGLGTALFVAGEFTLTGGGSMNGLARWNGISWSGLGGGLTGTGQRFARVIRPYQLLEDDAPVTKLFIGGLFVEAGGVTCNGTALWNGSTFESLGSGLNGASGFTPSVRAAAIYNDGSGPSLFAGGDFINAGGVQVGNIARFNGAAWRTVGTHAWVGDRILDMVRHDDGSGERLYAAGQFLRVGSTTTTITVPGIARWNGATWESVGSGLTGTVKALASAPEGPVQGLWACGGLIGPGGVGLVRWNGSTWQAFFVNGDLNSTIEDICVMDDGNGPAVYICGSFTHVGAVPAKGVAKFDGTSWSALGSGLSQTVGAFEVRTIRPVDLDADGPNPPVLVAGGRFDTAGGITTHCVASWDGSGWTGYGNTIANTDGVYSIGWHDMVAGRRLMIGGNIFSAALGTSTLAEWNGANWAPLGASPNKAVLSIENIDDGTGSLLWIGGEFQSIGGQTRSLIARWTGTEWAPAGAGLFGGGTGEGVRAIVPLSDLNGGVGSATAIVGGRFISSGGVSMNNIAAWAAPSFAPAVSKPSLAGSTVKEVAANISGSVPLALQWRRNGQALVEGNGITGTTGPQLTIDSALVDITGTYDLVATSPNGLTVSASVDLGEVLGDLDGNGVVDGADLAVLLGSWGGPGADLNGDGATDGADLALLLGAWGT